MKLNLGGKNTKISGFKTVDIYDGDNVDIVSDISKIDLPSDSVSEIYASHCLEHFKRVDTNRVLSEWYRLLSKGGKLYVAVPDFDSIVKYYSKVKLYNEMMLGLLYGNQDEPYNFHYVSFNFPNLAFELNKVGFKDVRKVASFGLLKDCSTITDNVFQIPMSLNVIAVK